jgi:hypothetical protein
MTTTEAQRPPLHLTPEGGGTVATCSGCGWLVWFPEKHKAHDAGRAHECPKRKAHR